MEEKAARLLADGVLARVPKLADELVRVIAEQNPGYRRINVVTSDDLRKSCHDNMIGVLRLIGRDGADEQLYSAARCTGRRRAEQRMPLDDVLRSFRLGGRLLWQALVEQARADGTVDAEGLLEIATWLWEVVDSTSAQVAAAYHVAEQQLVRIDEQRRATLWEGLLRGRGKDLAFAHEAARIIGVPVDGPYAAIVADVEDVNAPTFLKGLLTEHGIDSAWQLRAHMLVGLLSLDSPELGIVLKVLRDALTVPAGVSLVVHGLADVDVAYRQAVLARRSIQPGRVEVAALADRLPEALVLSSPELAEHLIRLRLGPLLKIPVGERRILLDTLETWVATAGSVSRTAELVHCHRNTVINRLSRIEAVTGNDLSDVPHLELSLALRASRLLPPGPLA
ncbi:PucR family transcriptional regulator [Kutzneria sp. CA-103260]|uniref:PucR family transcriptional regulator n=1 Tax=Kutzneria sp. CA-103260 TaxID=2802641 RepID=UPI001BA93BA9|nr:helix-turn-helix domain-containing protein [Kutzneria sp. CA-103260]QUQ62776.1 PucR family transcriptional regulator [Kutzneria sp. CA-103260]